MKWSDFYMFSFQKNRQVKESIQHYLEQIQISFEELKTGFDQYAIEGLGVHFDKISESLHMHESRADDIRNDLEIRLFEQSLIPDARSDIMRLLECLDDLPDQIQEIVRQIVIQQVNLPDFIHDDVRELIKLADETYVWVCKAINEAFGRNEKVREYTSEIDGNESIGDKLQQRTIRKLFQSDLPLAEKLLYRDIVNEVGELCDIEDRVGTILNLFTVKRSV
jgi:predicted phosphate transport protein (TIGR00153 family)